uniref:Putative secreted protein n=1 Tax=Anopheles darlingi TaxID=43151 RepID=A0A2M4DF54_ANODA
MVRSCLLYVSMHSIFLVPASAKHNSPLAIETWMLLGSSTWGLPTNSCRSVPSKLDHSILGPSRFQSDQNSLL